MSGEKFANKETARFKRGCKNVKTIFIKNYFTMKSWLSKCWFCLKVIERSKTTFDEDMPIGQEIWNLKLKH